jgi:hypothetical protein
MKTRNIVLAGIALLFLGIIFRLLWVLAATGFFSIPVFSSYAFHYPSPIRFVDPSSLPFSTYLSQQLSEHITGRLQMGRKFLQDPSFSIHLPEEILTMGLREKIKEQNLSDMVDITKAQIVIGANQTAEVFLPVFYRGKESPVRLSVSLFATDQGELQMKLLSVSIGSWRMPNWATRMVEQEYTKEILSPINENISRFAKLHRIDWQEKMLFVEGELSLNLPFLK